MIERVFVLSPDSSTPASGAPLPKRFMLGPVLPPLAAWESFYVILGSSAAALTGLQFVVIALGAEKKTVGGEATWSAFATPTIVHFCAVLLIAAIVSTPGQTAGSLS